MGSISDLDAYAAALAEDAKYADPTGEVFFVGKDDIVAWEQQWANTFEFSVEVTGTYLSADGAAYEERLPGLEMSQDPNAPILRSLIVDRFRDGQIVRVDEWVAPDFLDFHGAACFKIDGCPALQETVNRYVAAWSAHDPDAIAALYSDDAQFVDSMLSLAADTADAIGDLSDVRFGSTGHLTIEVLDLYVWTDGQYPPTESDPERGRLIGVAIHYRAESGNEDTTPRMQEGITTLILGTRHDTHIDADLDGLIHTEEVYHEPTSLSKATAAGFEPTTAGDGDGEPDSA